MKVLLLLHLLAFVSLYFLYTLTIQESLLLKSQWWSAVFEKKIFLERKYLKTDLAIDEKLLKLKSWLKILLLLHLLAFVTLYFLYSLTIHESLLLKSQCWSAVLKALGSQLAHFFFKLKLWLKIVSHFYRSHPVDSLNTRFFKSLSYRQSSDIKTSVTIINPEKKKNWNSTGSQKHNLSNLWFKQSTGHNLFTTLYVSYITLIKCKIFHLMYSIYKVNKPKLVW